MENTTPNPTPNTIQVTTKNEPGCAQSLITTIIAILLVFFLIGMWAEGSISEKDMPIHDYEVTIITQTENFTIITDKKPFFLLNYASLKDKNTGEQYFFSFNNVTIISRQIDEMQKENYGK